MILTPSYNVFKIEKLKTTLPLNVVCVVPVLAS